MSQPRVVWSYLFMLKFQCNLTEICFARESMLLVSVRVAQGFTRGCYCDRTQLVINQNMIFSALDCQRSLMEPSVLGFMRFDNIGFATSALAWPHQRALQQLGREGQDCTDGTDGRSFQIRKVTRLQSYKMHTFAHTWFVHLCSIFKNHRFF